MTDSHELKDQPTQDLASSASSDQRRASRVLRQLTTGVATMITLDDVRRLALALPETAEHTHFRLPAFQVNDKNFVVVRAGKARALLHVDEPDAHAAITEDPTVFEAERPGRPFGLWVDLASVTPERLERLIELAWRAKAPKKLVDTYDSNR
jgi:hypothetical protein